MQFGLGLLMLEQLVLQLFHHFFQVLFLQFQLFLPLLFLLLQLCPHFHLLLQLPLQLLRLSLQLAHLFGLILLALLHQCLEVLRLLFQRRL